MTSSFKNGRTSRKAARLSSAAQFVRAVGPEVAAALFLKFGGATVHLSDHPGPNSSLLAAIGHPAVLDLTAEFGLGTINVPLANEWLAQHLAGKGMTRSDIARTLRVSRESLRGMLAGPAAEVESA